MLFSEKGGKSTLSRQMQLSTLGFPVHAFFRDNVINDSIQHTVENEFHLLRENNLKQFLVITLSNLDFWVIVILL